MGALLWKCALLTLPGLVGNSPPHLHFLLFSFPPSSSWVIDSVGSSPWLPSPAGASAPQVFWVLSGELPIADGSQLLGQWQCHHSPHCPEWPMTDRFRYIKSSRPHILKVRQACGGICVPFSHAPAKATLYLSPHPSLALSSLICFLSGFS